MKNRVTVIAMGIISRSSLIYYETIGAISGANSIFRPIVINDSGDELVGQMCLVVVCFTFYRDL